MIRRFGLLLMLTAVAGCAATPPAQRVAVHPGAPQTYTATIRGTDVAFTMVWIPEGNFWIGETEVTWDQFLPYCDFDATAVAPPDAALVTKPSKPLDVAPYHRNWGEGTRPAVGVSWNAAKTYCKWLSINTGHDYRLPSEAEWRLACGETPEPLDAYAWYAANTDGKTEEVRRRKPNAHGVYDMLGNLWEYTRDPYDPAKPDRAALRGGSWKDPAEKVTPDARLRFNKLWTLKDPNVPPGVWWIPDGDHLGFRILRPGPDQEPTP